MSTNDVKPNKGDPELFAFGNCFYFNRPDVSSVVMNLKPVEKNIRRDRSRIRGKPERTFLSRIVKASFREVVCCF